MKDIKIFCYCLGGYFIFGGGIAYGVSEMFDWISKLDPYAASDPGFIMVSGVMNKMLSYIYWLMLFGAGYVALGIFLEKVFQQALWIHLLLTAGLLAWAVIAFQQMLPLMQSFMGMAALGSGGMNDPSVEHFFEEFNRAVWVSSIISGVVQFVIPQFFLGRMIWKKQKEAVSI